MKQHEIVQIEEPSSHALNSTIKSKEEQGWELITPIFFQPAVFKGDWCIISTTAFLTFAKNTNE